MQPLIIYTRRPEGSVAQQLVRFLSAANRAVQLRPLSELPAPISWLERRRRQLEQEKEDLRQAIGGLELGVALATAAPHRFPDGPRWTAEKQTHERRLRVVEWKLQQVAAPEGGSTA